jgi:alpha-galactosidase
MLREIRRAQPLYLGDYYPIVGVTPDPTEWAVYQMHRADMGEGMLMVLRRPDSSYSAATLRLNALNPDAKYRIEDADAAGNTIKTGRQLMEHGIPVKLPKAPGSKLVFYKESRFMRGGCSRIRPFPRRSVVPVG